MVDLVICTTVAKPVLGIYFPRMADSGGDQQCNQVLPLLRVVMNCNGGWWRGVRRSGYIVSSLKQSL